MNAKVPLWVIVQFTLAIGSSSSALYAKHCGATCNAAQTEASAADAKTKDFCANPTYVLLVCMGAAWPSDILRTLSSMLPPVALVYVPSTKLPPVGTGGGVT